MLLTIECKGASCSFPTIEEGTAYAAANVPQVQVHPSVGYALHVEACRGVRSQHFAVSKLVEQRGLACCVQTENLSVMSINIDLLRGVP